MRNDIFLSVIIPCYNEEANLRRGVLGEVAGYLAKQKFRYEVIVSDDGPTDASRKLVKEFVSATGNFIHLVNSHGGKPHAIWQGLKKACSKYVLFTDMDQSTPIREFDKLLPWIEDYDVVIGSRGVERKNFPFYRKIGAFAFRTFRKILMLRNINDTQCGFKLFKTETVKKIFPMLEFFRRDEDRSGWKVTSFDVELLFLLDRFGYKVKEVPVSWEDRDISTSKGGKKGRYFRESKEMLEQIVRVKLNDLRGKYDE